MLIHFPAYNNITEYEALLHVLCLASLLGVRQLVCHGDSDPVVQQVMKTWETKDPNMAAYYFKVCRLEGKFDGLKFHHVR